MWEDEPELVVDENGFVDEATKLWREKNIAKTKMGDCAYCEKPIMGTEINFYVGPVSHDKCARDIKPFISDIVAKLEKLI